MRQISQTNFLEQYEAMKEGRQKKNETKTRIMSKITYGVTHDKENLCPCTTNF